MTKVVLALYSVSRSLEFWSVSHTLIQENSELEVVKNITYFGVISNNQTIYWEQMYKILLNHVYNHC